MKKTILREYADLIVHSGVNIQKGQEVLIYAGLDQPEFVQMVVEAAYKAKAKKVTVEWHYPALDKLDVRYQTVKTLGTVTAYQIEKQKHYCETLPALIYLDSDDPDGLKGMNMEKSAKARQMSYPILKPYVDAREGKQQWCIAAVPGAAWSKKVFPTLRVSQAVENLWQAILFTSRVDGHAALNWKVHNEDLKARCAYLNDLHIAKLHYKAENGTDLTVGLIPEGIFAGGAEESKSGIWYNPNIPSEECFYLSHAGTGRGNRLFHQAPFLSGTAD